MLQNYLLIGCVWLARK